MTEVTCFRCSHVFEVAGEPEDMWVCEDCLDEQSQAATERQAERWHGGDTWPFGLGER